MTTCLNLPLRWTTFGNISPIRKQIKGVSLRDALKFVVPRNVDATVSFLKLVLNFLGHSCGVK